MNSADIGFTILMSLVIISVSIFFTSLLYYNHVETEHYINDGYQHCYIMGHGTEWMKECNTQVLMEKR